MLVTKQLHMYVEQFKGEITHIKQKLSTNYIGNVVFVKYVYQILYHLTSNKYNGMDLSASIT